MVRLQKEMSVESAEHFFEIKRGESAPVGAKVITNDQIGRALLSFDLNEPWAAHQIYKVFDEKYADIFGRPEVTAARVIFLSNLMEVVDAALPGLKNRPMASYTLTRYFLLYVLSRILRTNEESRVVVVNPSLLDADQIAEFMSKCAEILKTVTVDLDWESEHEADFDYKSKLKSPKQTTDLASTILASYEKDVARQKAETFAGWSAKPVGGLA